MAKRQCTHKKFVGNLEESGYKCKRCKKHIDINDACDLIDGEHEEIKGKYEQIVCLIRVE